MQWHSALRKKSKSTVSSTGPFYNAISIITKLHFQNTLEMNLLKHL